MKHNEVLWIGGERIVSSILVDPWSQRKLIGVEIRIN